MKTFEITMKEVYEVYYTVQAENQSEALELIYQGRIQDEGFDCLRASPQMILEAKVANEL